MDTKTDVKAMMARFQAANTDENSSSTPAGRTKQPLHPTLSSGVTTQPKKPVLESLSGSAINHPPKPPFLKNTVATKSTPAVHEPNKTKALAGIFANMQDENNTNSKPLIGNKHHIPNKSPLLQPPEAKDQVEKNPLIKPPISSTLSNTKPAFAKSSPTAKPSWIKEDSGGGGPSTTSLPPKIPPSQQKPSSSLIKLWQQNEEQTGTTTDAANKPSPSTLSALKKPCNFRTPQDILNKEDKNDQPDSDGVKNTLSKPPPKPPANKKPSLKKPSQEFQPNTSNSESTLGPKRNPLPNSLALGAAPSKPNRPPRVNLEMFKKAAEASDNGPGTFKNPIVPTLPYSPHPSNHNNYVTPPPPPPQPALPSLPPRHPGSMIQQEDFYDDVDELNSSAPPPLPLPTGHPSQRAKEDNSDDDGEMEEKKKTKKRLEKEQKEREKKEQETRKKFKLVGPIEVIHRGTAYEDCKGSKTDLALKQGDCLDIIRVQGNPEGKWLGRMQDGSIGYVKTTSVKIDFNSLKNHQAQQAYEPEVYDDIEPVASENSGTKGPGVVLPPLPGDGEEIYDDVDNPNLDISPLDNSPLDNRFSSTRARSFLRMFERSNRPVTTKEVPPPSQFTAQGNSDQVGGEEIYDDVDSQNIPPPLPSFPILKCKSRTEEVDQKKLKKLEKEEKDFRKKFKYDGEIQVLYQVTIVHTLTNKKWSGKELPLKAGETLDVIVKAVDNKLVCRNEEGKFGYVSTCYIVSDDGDIYDDIGDDCIYDND